MDKKNLLKSAENPHLISGIYNYCDRWCERCQFTSRCLQYSLEEQENNQLEEKDITNASFWQKVQESLELALSLVEDMAQEKGIDLDSMEIETDEDEENIVHLLCHKSKIYADMVNDWFDTHQYLLDSEVQKKSIHSHLKLIKPQETEISILIKDIKEVIRWYQYQIHVKLSRAIRSRKKETSPPLNEFPKDSEGSAKVALIGIDRSLWAWGELFNYFNEQAEGISKIVNFLKSLRDLTEEEFPHARGFIRPGFDE